MKHLIIIGAGGMGRTYFDMARESVGYGEVFDIKGYLDDNTAALDGFKGYPPMLGKISDYQVEDGDVFVCSVGGDIRKQLMEMILSRGGKFMTMIHHTARIGTNVEIGEGTVVGAFTTIGSEAKIGKCNMIQSYVVIGHDSVIGDMNRIDTHATIVGGVHIENETNIYTAAVINHGATVESNARVAACSFVIRTVKSGTLVKGNPAKTMKL